MKRSSKRSRRHKNPQNTEEQKQPFFSKQADQKDPQKSATPFFQPKLKIGQPNDKYEKEADQVADHIVNKNANSSGVQHNDGSSIQRYMTNAKEDELGTNTQRMEKDKMIQEKRIQRMEEEENVQMKEEEEAIQKMEEEEAIQTMEEEDLVQKKEEEEAVQAKEEEEPVQMKKNANAQPSSGLSKQLNNRKGQGNKLPKSTKAEMENAFGVDFSKVNIHTDQQAEDMNKQLGAQAFTHGEDIFFNKDKYNPGSKKGKELLAHELTHVVQQKQLKNIKKSE